MCDEVFENSSQLRFHSKNHKDHKPFTCNFCSATFTQKSNLKAHIRSHTGERPYPCTECSAAFAQMSNLKTHLKIHSGEKPHVCGTCSAAFSQASNLKSHELIHTGDRPHVCDVCDAAFVQSSHLRNHLRTHGDERPYSCLECDAKFKQHSNLKTHQKIHSGIKPFSCDMCDASFAQKSNLKTHILKIHPQNLPFGSFCFEKIKSKRGRKKKPTGIKSYECEECNAKFTVFSNLKIHKRLHSSEKSFACSNCDAKFAQKSNLKAHELIHSSIKPFNCPQCPSAFKQKSNMKTHLKKIHSIENVSKYLDDFSHVKQEKDLNLDLFSESNENITHGMPSLSSAFSHNLPSSYVEDQVDLKTTSVPSTSSISQNFTRDKEFNCKKGGYYVNMKEKEHEIERKYLEKNNFFTNKPIKSKFDSASNNFVQNISKNFNSSQNEDNQISDHYSFE